VSEFMDMVHHSDFFILNKDRKRQMIEDEWKLCIDYFNMGNAYEAKARKLRHVVEVISSGRLLDKRMKDAAAKFDKINNERIEKVLKDLYVVSGKIAIGFSKKVDSTDACMSVIRKAHTDVGIMVNLDNSKGSIRSVDSDIMGLANRLGGGGHPHASGFNLDIRKYNSFKSKRDRQAFADLVEKLAKKEDLI
jgi:nanoRNase/pAp phosphatase (c-di-AMP/oligoRNAs hydrolase)